MPPLFLAAAEVDVYCDSSLQLAREVSERGGRAEVQVYAGMTHLYWGYSRMVDTAARCTADIAAFLQRQLPA
jgi:acetyl esterase